MFHIAIYRECEQPKIPGGCIRGESGNRGRNAGRGEGIFTTNIESHVFSEIQRQVRCGGVWNIL